MLADLFVVGHAAGIGQDSVTARHGFIVAARWGGLQGPMPHINDWPA